MSQRTSKKDRQKKADGIPLTGKALKEIQGGLAAMKELKGKFDAFLGGYKSAAGVPVDWVLNIQKMAFVPRPKKEKSKK